MLDTRRPSARRRLRRTATALIVEDQLSPLREGRERWPQEVVVEQKPAVHAHERNGTGYFWREVHGELEASCTDGAPGQARRSRARASKSDEAFAGGNLW
jgi:hypothetical protein